MQDLLIDLDNTVYPEDSNIFAQIDLKMKGFIAKNLNVSLNELIKKLSLLETSSFNIKPDIGIIKVRPNASKKADKVIIKKIITVRYLNGPVALKIKFIES